MQNFDARIINGGTGGNSSQPPTLLRRAFVKDIIYMFGFSKPNYSWANVIMVVLYLGIAWNSAREELTRVACF